MEIVGCKRQTLQVRQPLRLQYERTQSLAELTRINERSKPPGAGCPQMHSRFFALQRDSAALRGRFAWALHGIGGP